LSAQGGFAAPGFSAAIYTTEREILWGRDDQHLPLLFRNSIISGATRDAGNSPTTILRKGLVLGQVTSTLELEEWDADASDGTQNIAAVLGVELRAQDFDANNVDRSYATLLRAPVIAGQLLIQGSAFVGHVDEFLARRQMVAAGFCFDDDPMGYLSGLVERYSLETATTDALLASQNGMTLFYNNAASVTVTLPAAKPGLVYEIVRAGDEELIVVSPTADNIVVGNDLSADGFTTTTAGEHLGIRWRLRSVYIDTTIKWLAEGPLTPFGTGTATPTYSIQS
jgi:hypothetical protein